MSFRFEGPANAVNQGGALENADFHPFVKPDVPSSPINRDLNPADKQPQLTHVNAWFIIRDHEAEKEAAAVREQQIYDTVTNHGQIQRFSGTPKELIAAQKLIDGIKKDVDGAVEFLAQSKGPYIDLPFLKYRNNVDIDGLNAKAEKSLTEAMKKDARTTFAMVLDHDDFYLTRAYDRAESRLGSAASTGQMKDSTAAQTPNDQTIEGKKLDEIKNDVDAAQILAGQVSPERESKAVDCLIEAMTQDIRTTFSLVRQRDDEDLTNSYHIAEIRVGLAERLKQMQNTDVAK